MKVKDLIKELEKLPDDMLVIRPGYEGGVEEITGCRVEMVALNVNSEWYYGKHETLDYMKYRPEDVKETKEMFFIY